MNIRFLFINLLFTGIVLASCDAGKSKSNEQNQNTKPITSLGDSAGHVMDEDEFWKIIDESRSAAGNSYEAQIAALKNILLKLDTASIVKFDNRFTLLLANSYDWKLWGAAYVINGGCSDDCFDYFRQYLIGHGKEKFYAVLKDPESCASWIKSEEEEEWEGLQYSAKDAYKQKTGKEIPGDYDIKFELKGTAFDEETVVKRYPKLAKKFME